MNYYAFDVDYNKKVDNGAQWHRMISLYCLVKYLNTNELVYVHNPIPDTSGIDQYFGLSRFVPGKFGIPTEFDDVNYENRPTFEELQLFYQNKKNVNHRVIYEIGYPEEVMKSHPEIYTDAVLKELQSFVTPAKNPAKFTKQTNIVIHIDDPTKTSSIASMIDSLYKKYGAEDSNICILATEDKSGDLDAYRAKKTVNVLPNLEFLEMFQYMSLCDVLIMSPTSIAYVAALYNSTAKDIFYTKSVFPKLAAWKHADTLAPKDAGIPVESKKSEESFQSIQSAYAPPIQSEPSYELPVGYAFWFAIILLVIVLMVVFYMIVSNESFSWRNWRRSMFRIVRR